MDISINDRKFEVRLPADMSEEEFQKTCGECPHFLGAVEQAQYREQSPCLLEGTRPYKYGNQTIQMPWRPCTLRFNIDPSINEISIEGECHERNKG